MGRFNLKSKIKIILVLTLAFGVSQLIGRTIFVADSPLIRRNLGQYIATNISSMMVKVDLSFLSLNFLKGGSQKNVVTQPAANQRNNQQSIHLKQVSKGIYAAEDNQGKIKKVEYRLDEIDWVEYTFTVNGRQVTIKMPKSQPTPRMDVLEKIYQ